MASFVFLIILFFVDCLALCCGSCQNSSTDLIDIHIIGFFPCTDPSDRRGIPVGNCDGIERIPIMKLALEEINERCDLLPGYRLVVDYANSACSSVSATYHLIQQTDASQPTKLMILGPACSAANEIMGGIAEKYLSITQVSYTASSKMFENKTRFPRFYRLVSTAEDFADGFVAVVKRLKWNRVAVLSYDEDFVFNLGEHTVATLNMSDIDVISNDVLTEDNEEVLNRLKEINARIMIAWLPPSPLKIVAEFWCSVIKKGLVGPNFVWLFPGWFAPNWWNYNGTDCFPKDMISALDHSLGFRGNSEDTKNHSRVIVSNRNVSYYEEQLLVKNENITTDVLLSVGYVYDAVWTIALALNSSISILEERGLGRLEDFTYDSVEMADVFTEAVKDVSFEGISGNVSFVNSTGNRMQPSLEIFQYNGGKTKTVFTHDSNMLYNSSNPLQWQGGSLPKDAPDPVDRFSTVAECVIASVTASIGIITTAFFFIFNFRYSKHIVIKRSSYRLNSLILVGVFIGFTGTVLHIIHLDSDMPEALTTTVCNARVWTSELAFVMAFGALFVKIWRLYKIFFNRSMIKRKYLEDKYLFIVVAVIAAPSLVILIVRAAAFPLELCVIEMTDKDNVAVEERYYECKADHEFIFLGISYAEKGILALLSILVAYQTRKYIPRNSIYHKYNESAVINLTTILAILLSSICQAVLIIFRLNRIYEGLLLIVTLRDCLWMYPMIYLLFVPKIYRVRRGMIPQQLSTINSLILNATQPLAMTPVRRRSNGNMLDQPSHSSTQKKDVKTCICKENLNEYPCERNISEIDSKSHKKEISFDMKFIEPHHKERSPNKYIATLGTVRIELPVEESTKL